MTKKMVNRCLGGDIEIEIFASVTLRQVINNLIKIMEEVPEEHRDSCVFKMEHKHDYDSDFAVSWKELESDQEYEERLERERVDMLRAELLEQREYERLKFKYGDK